MGEIVLDSLQFGEIIGVTVVYVIVAIYLWTINDEFNDKQYGLISASISVSFSVLMGTITWSLSTFAFFLAFTALGAFAATIGRWRRNK